MFVCARTCVCVCVCVGFAGPPGDISKPQVPLVTPAPRAPQVPTLPRQLQGRRQSSWLRQVAQRQALHMGDVAALSAAPSGSKLSSPCFLTGLVFSQPQASQHCYSAHFREWDVYGGLRVFLCRWQEGADEARGVVRGAAERTQWPQGIRAPRGRAHRPPQAARCVGCILFVLGYIVFSSDAYLANHSGQNHQ